MGRKRATAERAYTGLEPGLWEAIRNHYISCDKRVAHQTKNLVEQIVKKIIDAMRKQSPVFASLYQRNFGGGSIYDGLKIGEADEFDIDILLKMPEVVKPVLVEDKVAGFAQLRLTNFQNLARVDPEMHNVMKQFVDEGNYLLPKKMKSSFMQSIFDKTLLHQLSNKSVEIGKEIYNITRVQHLGPAFTLTLDGPNLPHVAVDLVPSILLRKEYWPDSPCRSNPYDSPKLQDFFLAPTSPKQDHLHRDRFWRLSFHIQERQLIFNRYWMKPTIRTLKCMRDHFGHSVRSYAIKTVFLWELEKGNAALDAENSDLWTSPFSFVVIYMLERYLECLKDGSIPDFWNRELNLLCHLTPQQLQQCRQDVAAMLTDIKKSPTPEVLLKFLK